MTPEAARLALANQGFNLSDDTRTLSWAAQVSAEAGKYTNTPKVTTQAIVETVAEGPGLQRVTVTYEINPDGSSVKEVKYIRPSRGGNLFYLAVERYGPPTRIGYSTFHYCPQVLITTRPHFPLWKSIIIYLEPGGLQLHSTKDCKQSSCGRKNFRQQ